MKFKSKLVIYYSSMYLFLFYLACNIPLVADDFSYSVSRKTFLKMNGLGDVLISQLHEYKTWNGRLIANFINQVFLLDNNRYLFKIFFPIVVLAIISSLFLIIKGRKIEKDNDFLLMILLTFLVFSANMAVLNQTMFWITGFSTYVVTLMFLVIGLIPISNIILNRSNSMFITKNRYFLFFIGVFASFSVEHYTLIMIGFLIIALIVNIYRNKKIVMPENFMYLILGVVIGSFLLYLAPGLWARNSLSMNISRNFIERLYYGYTRFIYTYFILNQKILALLSMTLLAYIFQNKKIKLNTRVFLIVMQISVVAITLYLGFNLPFIPFQGVKLILNSEWMFYEFGVNQVISYSLIYVYEFAIILTVLFVFSMKQKNIFPVITYLASFFSMFSFIITDMAVERTSYVSYILLVIVTICILDSYIDKIKLKLLPSLIILISLCILRFGTLGYNYHRMYDIYQHNSIKIEFGLENNLEEVVLYRYDYRYIFKSDLIEDDQENWIFNAMRRFYGLDKMVKIIYVDKE